jgi:hypothetical protein
MAVNKPDPVRNLGHKSTEASLTKNPAGRMVDYTNNAVGKKMLRQPSRLQGVYGKCSDPRSGISSAENLQAWSKYSTKDSYHRGPGPGKEPTMPDPRERATAGYRPNGNQQSDGYLESTRGWAGYDRGADSGEGRLQKARKY